MHDLINWSEAPVSLKDDIADYCEQLARTECRNTPGRLREVYDACATEQYQKHGYKFTGSIDMNAEIKRRLWNKFARGHVVSGAVLMDRTHFDLAIDELIEELRYTRRP